ncbi:Uncharacterised protein [Corynebacterium minutissimum]|uniref:Uncharacterized protein n=1 Tax=Corynebacterium minutissimum TaxID=38301 RepID=A0A376GYF3_9CORY|nr:Uncharacterised protein [Corynebacterium minutissimum]
MQHVVNINLHPVGPRGVRNSLVQHSFRGARTLRPRGGLPAEDFPASEVGDYPIFRRPRNHAGMTVDTYPAPAEHINGGAEVFHRGRIPLRKGDIEIDGEKTPATRNGRGCPKLP